MTLPAILLDNAVRTFGTTRALDQVSLAIRPGELVGLLGPSGSGKSTLFRCLTALDRVDHGTVQVLGQDIGALRGAALRALRRDIGLIFQQFNLIGRMHALDNTLAGRLGHTPTWRVMLRQFPRTDRQLALSSLDRVGLLERAYQRADSLSGGQQQRVAIARVLTQQSRLVLADEPISSLDPEAAHTVLSALRSIAHDHGIAVLCSLHQVDMALAYTDRILGLRQGRLVLDQATATLDAATLAGLYRPGAGQDGGRHMVPAHLTPATPPALTLAEA